MKLLLLNVGIKNKGNQALIEASKKIIQEYVTDVQFIQMGADTKNTSGIVSQPAQKPLRSPYPWFYLLYCWGVGLLRKCGIKKRIPRKSPLFYFDDADLIVNSGGDQLSGEKFVGSSFFNLLYGILLGKPVVLFAESLGYYRRWLNRVVAKFVFSRVKLILVRETLSKEYLLNLGIDPAKIFLTADPAYLLEPASRERIDEILIQEKLSSMPRPLIGINPSSMISKFRGTGLNAEQEYVALISDVIDTLVESRNCSVLLVPHVYAQGNDDRTIIRKILNSVSHKSAVYQIKEEYSAAELKGLIGTCDLFVGARMHATIASTSLAVPTVGIAYSHKMKGIIGDALGMNDYIIEISKLNSENLLELINRVWENRETIRKDLKLKVPEIRKRALLNGQYLKDYLTAMNGQKS